MRNRLSVGGKIFRRVTRKSHDTKKAALRLLNLLNYVHFLRRHPEASEGLGQVLENKDKWSEFEMNHIPFVVVGCHLFSFVVLQDSCTTKEATIWVSISRIASVVQLKAHRQTNGKH